MPDKRSLQSYTPSPPDRRRALEGLQNKYIPARSVFLLGLCLVICLILMVRLLYLQIFSYEYYQAKVLDNVQAETTVTADRGVICDCNGVALATNYTVYRIFISPRDIEDETQKALICQGLSDLLSVNYDTVKQNADMSFYADRTIKRNVEEDQANKVLEFVSANDLERQIHVSATSKRVYPYGTVAAKVLGFVGTDGGVLGLELRYNDYLTGVPGRYITARNARGQSMSSKYESYIEAVDGCTLNTTIDLNIQRALENQLAKTYVDSQSLYGVTGIAISVETGGILAMADYPTYDPNAPYTLDENSQSVLDALGYAVDSEEYKTAKNDAMLAMWKNKAISWLYEPGSTFKIVTSASALEAGVITTETVFSCYGSYRGEGFSKPIRCHNSAGHGTQPFYRMLQKSCNPTMMQVAARLGRAAFYKYFQAFGYTSRTGIDLPSEEYPVYHAYSNFNTMELAIASFGQQFKVTPLRQITSLLTVANGGYLVTPHIVDSAISTADGSTVYSYQKDSVRQVVSTEVCDKITAILEQGVATDGGAKNAYVAGYKVAAKTGTSQVMDILDEFGNDYLRVGSTVAYAPADDPKIMVIICVDSPQIDNVFGAYVAAPYIAAFLSEVLPYLGVERNYSEADLAKISVTLRNYVGLGVTEVSQDLNNRGISFEVKGSGDTVTYQIPLGGSQLNRSSGKVTLYCGDEQPDVYREVPSVIGYTATKANTTLTNQGFNVHFEGSENYSAGNGAVAITQSPAAGESVPVGTVVTVTMRHLGDTD